jgi:hypothetical protein
MSTGFLCLRVYQACSLHVQTFSSRPRLVSTEADQLGESESLLDGSIGVAGQASHHTREASQEVR